MAPGMIALGVAGEGPAWLETAALCQQLSAQIVQQSPGVRALGGSLPVSQQPGP